MRRIIISAIIFLTLLSIGYSQVYETGIPFITNYTPQGTTGTQHFSVVQDFRGVLYFGNNDGEIMEYDGVNWRSIPIANRSFVRSLQVDDYGTVYAGGVGEFGYLAPDIHGKLNYVSLLSKLDSSDLSFGHIWRIYNWNGNIYFCDPYKIFKYLPVTDTVQVIDPPSFGFRNGLFSFVVNDRFYHGDIAAGLLELVGDSLRVASGGEFFIRKFITSMLPYNETEIFIGTNMSGAFLYDPETGTIRTGVFEDQANPLLMNRNIFTGIRYSDELYALGAITSGGGFIIDKEGKPIHRFTKETGLQDETIVYLYANPNQPGQNPLWFALNIGIAKAELNAPFRVFRENEGFEGNINDIIRFDGILYLATSSGVYYLSDNGNGGVRFRKVNEINANSWTFHEFQPGDNRMSRLLVGTDDGLFDLSRDGKATLIDDKIRNKLDESRFVTFDIYQPPGEPKIYMGIYGGFVILNYENGVWYKENIIKLLQDENRSIVQDEDGRLFISTLHNGIYIYEFTETGDTIGKQYTTENGLPSLNENYIYHFDDRTFFATDKGLYRYDIESDSFYPDTLFGRIYADGTYRIFRIQKDKDGDFWLSVKQEDTGNIEVLLKSTEDGFIADDTPFKRLSRFSTDAFYSDDNGIMWMGKSNELYRFDKNFVKDFTIPYNTLVRRVIIDVDSVIFSGTNYIRNTRGKLIPAIGQPDDLNYAVKFDHNDVTFQWAAPYFDAEEATEYRYWLEGNDKEWTRWSDRTDFTYTNLRRGHYLFKVQARNVYGVESETGTFAFTILPPWYQTAYAIVAYIILFIALVVVIVKLYTRRLVMENIRLEGIVAERTAEVVRQKEELTDSIEYASRIQRALLPSEKVLFESLPKHFILFKPRDIVSGDFYWMTQRENKVFIVAADCTGHGVPGAFMSMLGISFLNEIVNKTGITQSNLILDELREHVMQSLKQTGEGEDETKDGMDLSLCVIDKEKRHIQFSGAYNPLLYVRPLSDKERKTVEKGEELKVDTGVVYNDNYILFQVRGDKMPIGISAKNHESFNLHELEMKPGYTMYMFSDGYVDQFGGPEGKKFMSKAFKRLLLDVQDYPMEEQRKILEDNLQDWMGDLAQIDDIIVIGIKLE
ncbi:MAG: SpoIIE family protein phosphatase [Bacteroidales bacterium]|nr:MAG: SpoIIE family protein phosphatase [Bacteroidales bacterium]